MLLNILVPPLELQETVGGVGTPEGGGAQHKAYVSWNELFAHISGGQVASARPTNQSVPGYNQHKFSNWVKVPGVGRRPQRSEFGTFLLAHARLRNSPAGSNRYPDLDAPSRQLGIPRGIG